MLADYDAFTVGKHINLIRGADSKCAAHPDGKNNMTEHVNCSDDSSGFQLYQPPIIYRGFIYRGLAADNIPQSGKFYKQRSVAHIPYAIPADAHVNESQTDRVLL